MDAMLAAVGRGIQAFAGVETAYAYLFAELMEPASSHLALVVLGAARHFETKLSIINAVGNARLDGDILLEFRSLIKKTNRRVKLRNKLAHWTTGFWHKEMPIVSVADMTVFEVRLYPASKTPGNIDFQPANTVRLCEVQAFASSCGGLTSRILNFYGPTSNREESAGRRDSARLN